MADGVRGSELSRFHPDIETGIRLHRSIDSFTDRHPIVSDSKDLFRPRHNHWSAVIVDILYDHFLAARWQRYHESPLDEYVGRFYELLRDNLDLVPDRVRRFAPLMIQHDWIGSYATRDGIDKILKQMHRRTGLRSDMDTAYLELDEYYEQLENQFHSFFAELQAHAAAKLIELQS